MTAILHLVAEDFVSGQPLASRVGTYSAVAIATAQVDTPYRAARSPAPAVRKSYKFGPQLTPTIDGVVVQNDSAHPIWPVAGQARTFQFIGRSVAAITGLNAFQLIFAAGGDQDQGFILATGAQNAYGAGADVATEIYNLDIGHDDIDHVTYAPASDGLYHFWSLVLDFTATPLYKIYDGTTLVWTANMPFAIATLAVLATSNASKFGLQMEQSLHSDYYGELVELMVHDVALTAEQIKQRTSHFRSFG